ncbi:DNA phosphorothioation-associated putative methyltransferase [Cylindrospermum stagnale PCC 7417]|uniref:DNA phosphorothioation-associated putative methyltransferase n=1 Tax=Cylindrospermum stagnale PCC 7417 TaxID=56107 RepID=K9X2T4_9NOST|nr:DNA phosphorothioation-associated putative methyltransferase [Cylindrospermum stagnale]AFZ26950.1 DNA phosphorothioation-associated putative methyltransferase [Cylindrospermum stagnale PCC 7417]
MVKPDNSFNTLEETCLTPEATELSAYAGGAGEAWRGSALYEAIAFCCQNSSFGKLLPDAFYIHVVALQALDPLLQGYESRARSIAPQAQAATLVKFSTNKPKISYLFYPDFDTDPHPALQASIQVDLETLEVNFRDYSNSENPPVLHRKETFVTPDYHLYEQFAALTRAQEALGLLANSRGIGTRLGWQQRLQDYGVEIQGYTLIQRQATIPRVTLAPRIDRHKAAIVRNDLSRPVRLALEANLFTPDTTFFDYGCGHGGDVNRLEQQGYNSCGWDPYYSPDTRTAPADIVNIGFVINVIEDQSERRDALVQAWELTQKVLLVAAQVLIADTNRGVVAYGDGVITNRNTFQKYYDQEELKIYIDQVLGVDAIPVALGVYFVFKDEAQAQSFRASRYRSRATTPRVRACIKRFEEYQDLLAPLMSFMTERGRLPSKDELPQEADISAEFGSLRRAFQVILQATDPQEWQAISEKRRQDLMVYLALCQFSRRPKLATLAPEAQDDILGLFGTYKQAWLNAEQMLHSLGNTEIIVERCQNSPVGKKLANSLWVHISALQSLDPLLRLYEGCASRTIGRLEETNVIKFHTKTPKISYLFYPDFDADPHPGLHTGMEIDLRDLHVTYRDYDIDDDPPVLHQKDALVTPDYWLYEKFAKLTRQEEDWGLLNNWRSISHRSGWRKCLADNCAILKNYNLYWRKDADPYKLKVLRSAVESRQHKRRKAIKNQQSELDTSTNIELEEC